MSIDDVAFVRDEEEKEAFFFTCSCGKALTDNELVWIRPHTYIYDHVDDLTESARSL
jgi:hypothetical protein